MDNKAISEFIANEINKRLDQGGKQYGQPQITKDIIDNDPRDWLEEAFEEALDLVFYLFCAIMRRNGKRVD
jgi:hypothetical protein